MQLLRVKSITDGSIGYINVNGQVVIKPVFYDAGFFDDLGLAVVRPTNRSSIGYINQAGELAIKPTLFSAQEFSKVGLASVSFFNKADNFVNGYIDTAGKVQFIVDCESCGTFDDVLHIARIRTNNYYYGYIDKNNQIVIPPTFEKLGEFSSNGLARAMRGKSRGYINLQGDFVTKLKFRRFEGFDSSFLAWFKYKKKYGYINAQGEIVIEPIYSEAASFHIGLAKVKVNRKYGFINTKGEFEIPPILSNVSSFSSAGHALFVDRNKKMGCIDKIGAILIKPKYDDIDFSDYPNILMVVKEGERGYMDIHENWISNYRV